MEQVALPNYESHTVKHVSIRFDLFSKTSERVLVALEFETVQLTVNDNQVDPRKSMLNAQLLKNHSFRVTHVLSKQRLLCRDSNLGVIHKQLLHHT